MSEGSDLRRAPDAGPGGDFEIVRTRSGAPAIRSLAAGEIMHPGVGATAEAEGLYVFQSRLAARLGATSGTLTLFDVGLGAGANALAARAVAEAAPASAARLEIVSFERDLGALALALTTPGDFGLEGEPGQAARALMADGVHETARCLWRLVKGDALTGLAAETARADIVYWDPFSPRRDARLWSVAAFALVRARAADTCTLFTYSASTATRVALLLAGWSVGLGDATGNKAHTTAAAVRLADLSRPLDGSWLTRVGRADAPLPPDAPPDAAARVAALPQFRP